MSVTIEPAGTSSALARQLDEMKAAAKVAMRTAVGVVARDMRELAPGSISEHIGESVTAGLGTVNGAAFATQDFAKFVDEGTGLYVEHHSPIRPVAARRLANPRAALKLGNGQFRRSVKGQRPQRFVQRAREHAELQVVDVLEHAADPVIDRLRT